MSNTTTRNFTRHHGWKGQNRKKVSIRLPEELYEQLYTQAIKSRMTLTDYMAVVLETILRTEKRGKS